MSHMQLRLLPLSLVVIVAVAALPAQSTPAACAADCTIMGHSYGYVAPVMEIRSGASVVWTSLDTAHTNAEGAPLSAVPTCFLAGFYPVRPADPVRFDIVGDELRATVGATTKTCTDARPLPDGSFLLAYHCLQHPLQMRGALVVSL